MPMIDYAKRPKINYSKRYELDTLLATIETGNGTYRIWQIGPNAVAVTLQCPDQPERLAFDRSMPYPRALRAVAWAISSF